MRLSDLLTTADVPDATTFRVAGVVVGIVTNNSDPDGLGRVKVRFPWLSDEDESPWARVATLMAGKSRGAWFLPEIDDEVLVAFDRGDIRLPYVVGSLWNGQDTPPAANDGGGNDVRMIKSRSGHIVRFNDKDGAETIEIIDKTGKNSVLIDSAKNAVAINSAGDITLTAGGKVTITASGALTVKGATVDIN